MNGREAISNVINQVILELILLKDGCLKFLFESTILLFYWLFYIPLYFNYLENFLFVDNPPYRKIVVKRHVYLAF